ncbi:hypothetical protein SRABI35_01255 [Stenotrophomonas lactitubi]|nr:hypothetical protein SRABI35_01255 [Stenotrophomonas lactitubi]
MLYCDWGTWRFRIFRPSHSASTPSSPAPLPSIWRGMERPSCPMICTRIAVCTIGFRLPGDLRNGRSGLPITHGRSSLESSLTTERRWHQQHWVDWELCKHQAIWSGQMLMPGDCMKCSASTPSHVDRFGYFGLQEVLMSLESEHSSTSLPTAFARDSRLRVRRGLLMTHPALRRASTDLMGVPGSAPGTPVPVHAALRRASMLSRPGPVHARSRKPPVIAMFLRNMIS